MATNIRKKNEVYQKNMHKRGNVKKSLKQEESKFKVDPWLMGFLLFVVFGSTVFGMFMIPKLQ